MTSIPSLKGGLGRAVYLSMSAAIFFSQHLFAVVLLLAWRAPFTPPWWFWFNPLRLLAFNPVLPAWAMWSVLAVGVLVNGAIVALSLRRARTIGANGALASLALAPGLQLLVILWLSLAPARPDEDATSGQGEGKPTARDAVFGLFVGVALCVAAVGVSTLLLGLYGYGLFIASPFVVGLTTGYIVNRKADRGDRATLTLVLGALVLGAAALIGFAFEGAVCIVMASPLIGVMGLFGGLIGRSLAVGIGRRRGPKLMSVALLPLVLAGEVVLPPRASFDSVETVVVAASPSAVWDSIVHMGPIPDAPAAPFRWGLAYPLSGQIFGSGVGAIRQGVFSTGVAYERVTDWQPERKLSFIVLSDPPSMHELSPYSHVNAPHVIGYFKTLDASFSIQPLSDGKTRLSLTTHHELDLEPALYWIPLAEWAVHANKVRVLDHFRDQAEAEAKTRIFR